MFEYTDTLLSRPWRRQFKLANLELKKAHVNAPQGVWAVTGA